MIPVDPSAPAGETRFERTAERGRVSGARFAPQLGARTVLAGGGLLLAAVFVTLCAASARPILVPPSIFAGSVGLAALAVGVAGRSSFTIGASMAVLLATAALAQLGGRHGSAGVLAAAVGAACLFLSAELSMWSGEIRAPIARRAGVDRRRWSFIALAALAGAALALAVVSLAVAGFGNTGSLVLLTVGAVAACLVLLIAALLVAAAR